MRKSLFFLLALASPLLASHSAKPKGEFREKAGIAGSQIFYKTARIADQAILFPLSIVYDRAAYRGKELSSYTLDCDQTFPFLRHKVVGDTEETIPFER
jgi:hypothetical protein